MYICVSCCECVRSDVSIPLVLSEVSVCICTRACNWAHVIVSEWLYMQVYVYVCLHMCVSMRVFERIYGRGCVFEAGRIYAFVHEIVSIRMCVYVGICMCTYDYLCVHLCTYVWVRICVCVFTCAYRLISEHVYESVCVYASCLCVNVFVCI